MLEDSSKAQYEDPHELQYSDDEIRELLKKDDLDELRELPIRIGLVHPDPEFAQEMCIALAEHEDEWVRRNALLGISYVALNHQTLDRELVRKLIRNTEEDESSVVREVLEDVIGDILHSMKWKEI